jgi:acyl-CoA reductase-like NAD-dependent aldehyde dehydrogenase
LKSAFGFQGEKCSALSRLIIHEAIYERFMDRFREAIVGRQPVRRIQCFLLCVRIEQV